MPEWVPDRAVYGHQVSLLLHPPSLLPLPLPLPQVRVVEREVWSLACVGQEDLEAF